MRLAFLALASALPVASSALPPASQPAPGPIAAPAPASAMPSRFCRDDMRVRPVRSPEGSQPKRLGELPSGDLTLAVVNRVGDCIEPVTVRQGYGLGGR